MKCRIPRQPKTIRNNLKNRKLLMLKAENRASRTGKDGLLAMIRNGETMTRRQQVALTLQLSAPAMLAQLSSIIMQYIDASMVGSLGANDSASIGIVSSSTWLFAGICSAATTGFSVQVAHLIGANRHDDARRVLKQALTACFLFGLFMGILGIAISPKLPLWLGGSPDIAHNATIYFFVFSLCLPILIINFLAAGMLRCSGNMKIPSMLNILMCVLDVVFNFFFIFPTREISLGTMSMTIPGLGMGVLGATLGTTAAEVIAGGVMFYYMVFRSPEIGIAGFKASFRPTANCLRRAVKIAMPMGFQHIVMCTAQIIITIIVAPLGTIAIAANAFAITAESLCYMPGYGIADAATTLVGQSIGAKRVDLTKQFAGITVTMGIVVMSMMGVLLYVFAPMMMSIISPVPEIVELGAQCLRIEAFAEPLFAASIVAYGVFVGAGDTLKPCGMNIVSMWVVRLTLAWYLAPIMGLSGVWLAMCIELCFRGIIFLARLFSGKWTQKALNQ